MENETEKLGKYGHHPDPEIDAGVEAEVLEGRLCEAWAAGGIIPAIGAMDLADRLARTAPRLTGVLPDGYGTAVDISVTQVHRPGGSLKLPPHIMAAIAKGTDHE